MFKDAPHDIFVTKQTKIVGNDILHACLSQQRSVTALAQIESCNLLQKLIIVIDQSFLIFQSRMLQLTGRENVHLFKRLKKKTQA